MLVACGCGKSKEQCRNEPDELARYLGSFDHSITWPIDVKPPAGSASLPALDVRDQPIVQLDGHHVSIADFKVDTEVDRLADALTDVRAQWNERPYLHRRTTEHEIIVAIDQATPAADVAALFRALHAAHYDEVEIALAKPAPTVEPPPPSSIDAELDAAIHAEPNDRAQKLAQVISGVVKSCPAIQKVFGMVSSEENGDKAGTILAGIPDALVDCRCDVDMAALRTSMYRLMFNPRPVGQIAITLADSGAKLATSGTWREVASGVKPGPIDPR